jgi:hypothetical protein
MCGLWYEPSSFMQIVWFFFFSTSLHLRTQKIPLLVFLCTCFPSARQIILKVRCKCMNLFLLITECIIRSDHLSFLHAVCVTIWWIRRTLWIYELFTKTPTKSIFLHTHVKVAHLADAELADVLKQEENTLLIDSLMLTVNTFAAIQGQFKNYSPVYSAEVSAVACRWWWWWWWW